MIEVEKFDLYITMTSGRKHVFEVSGTELDWLFDKMFERESGMFQNFGTEIVSREEFLKIKDKDTKTVEVINVFEIEYLKYEKVNDESTEF